MLTDASISTTHGRIEDRGDAWAVVDLGSTHGMRVDDERIAESILTHQARVQIGKTILRFEIRDETAQASSSGSSASTTSPASISVGASTESSLLCSPRRPATSRCS